METNLQWDTFMRAWTGPKRPSRLSIRGIHLNISLYGKLLIPGGTGNYIHHCMQQGAYLNPSIFYNEGSKIQKDPEVMRGVMICIERMYPDQDIQDQINMQRDMYKESSGMFGFSSTQRLREKKMPGKIQFVNLTL
jgi:hypothetical protein